IIPENPLQLLRWILAHLISVKLHTLEMRAGHERANLSVGQLAREHSPLRAGRRQRSARSFLRQRDLYISVSEPIVDDDFFFHVTTSPQGSLDISDGALRARPPQKRLPSTLVCQFQGACLNIVSSDCCIML